MASASVEEIRAHVLAEHGRLRDAFAALVGTALPTSCKVAHGVVRAALEEFRRVLSEHLSLEECELVPLLRDADAWGAVRVDQLRARHASLQQALERLATELEPGRHERCDLVARVEDIVAALFGDIDDEVMTLETGSRASSVVEDQMTG